MEAVRRGIDRLAAGVEAAAGTVSSTVCEIGRASVYAARTFASPAGLRGMAVEAAWLAAHGALYPAGAAREQLIPAGGYRTDDLDPLRRSLLVTDVEAAGTPILLIHGIMDNRSVFTVFRRALLRRGFGVVHAVNYSLFTGDLRAAAHQLRGHVERLCEQTGSDRVHIVGHSLGGVIARYYVQRMGGAAHVDTLVTLGSPHRGTWSAYLMPTPLARQLRPGSPTLAQLERRAPGCSTRFLVVWSRMDEMVVPQRNARIDHPDLSVEHLELRDVGHLSLPIDRRVVRWVTSALARSDHHRYAIGAGPSRGPGLDDTVGDQATPAS